MYVLRFISVFAILLCSVLAVNNYLMPKITSGLELPFYSEIDAYYRLKWYNCIYVHLAYLLLFCGKFMKFTSGNDEFF